MIPYLFTLDIRCSILPPGVFIATHTLFYIIQIFSYSIVYYMAEYKTRNEKNEEEGYYIRSIIRKLLHILWLFIFSSASNINDAAPTQPIHTHTRRPSTQQHGHRRSLIRLTGLVDILTDASASERLSFPFFSPIIKKIDSAKRICFSFIFVSKAIIQYSPPPLFFRIQLPVREKIYISWERNKRERERKKENSL